MKMHLKFKCTQMQLKFRVSNVSPFFKNLNKCKIQTSFSILFDHFGVKLQLQ